MVWIRDKLLAGGEGEILSVPEVGVAYHGIEL